MLLLLLLLCLVCHLYGGGHIIIHTRYIYQVNIPGTLVVNRTFTVQKKTYIIRYILKYIYIMYLVPPVFIYLFLLTIFGPIYQVLCV